MNIIKQIKNSKEISNIWLSKSLSGKVLLENDTGLPEFPIEYKKSHAYNGALILAKTLFTKNIIEEYCKTVLEIDVNDNKKKWYKQIMRAICLHGVESLSPKLDITTDFFSVYLIIIDELQTYGRKLSSDTCNAPINPKDVGFHWDADNPKKLVIDMITTDAELRKECAAHNRSAILAKLSKKINVNSLANIE